MARHLLGRPPPRLRSADLAWGWGGVAAAALLRGSRFLHSLELRCGASLSDWQLGQWAGACPHLRSVKLSFATVSDAGEVPALPCGLSLQQATAMDPSCLRSG